MRPLGALAGSLPQFGDDLVVQRHLRHRLTPAEINSVTRDR